MRFRPHLAAVLVAAAPVAASAQNQLANPGFESGTLSGWTVGGPQGGSVFVRPAGSAIPADPIFGVGSSLVLSGNYSASGSVRGNCCTAPEPFNLSQTLSLVGGATYTLGFSLVNAGNGRAFGMSIGDGVTQIYFNGVGLLATDFANPAPGTWLPFSATAVATGANDVVTFEFIGSGTAYAPISVDDFFVNGPSVAVVTPEPSALALLGGGLLLTGFVRRRRR